MQAFDAPYLLFLGSARGELEAKTAMGLVHWRPEDCVGQYRLGNCRVDTGLPDMSPAEAHARGAHSLVIGIAPAGGGIDTAWIPGLLAALEAGLDLVSGLHAPLSSIPEIDIAATRYGRRLIDIRVPPAGIPVASGARRTGKRVLTVGTDCCVGKKYTALALHRAMQNAGMNATFRATGQTGIMISGAGIPMDAVVSDFLPGAAEILSPDNQADHWDVIEGQGSLFHPAYAAVTLGLVHGSQPDALVLCHEAGRVEIDERPGYRIPDLGECIRQYLQAASLTNPAVQCIGVSINTKSLPAGQRRDYLQALSKEFGLPCVDPVFSGVDALLEPLSKI